MPTLLVLAIVASLTAGTTATSTLYDELEIPPGATQTQIRKAYRTLALRHHPDKANLPDSAARFIRISEAYETLSNTLKRAAYDATLQHHWSRGSSGGNENGADQAGAYEFTFSLKDAFSIFELFVTDKFPAALGERYTLAKAALSTWAGFELPLPELLQSGMLRTALDSVDWVALGTSAKGALKRAFESDDGDVDWLKVAGVTAAGVTAVASALDATDDGNRTATLMSYGSKALSWLSKAVSAAAAGSQTEKDEN